MNQCRESKDKLDHKLEQSDSSYPSYKPRKEDYKDKEYYLKNVANKVVKDMLKKKGKRTSDARVNNNYREAPFIAEIMSVQIPSNLNIPSLKYDRTKDHDDHLLAFESQMDLYNA